MKYEVEQGIPVTSTSKHSELYETLESLKEGESFAFESQSRQNLYQRAAYKKIKVAIRKEGDDRCRVWKTA